MRILINFKLEISKKDMNILRMCFYGSHLSRDNSPSRLEDSDDESKVTTSDPHDIMEPRILCETKCETSPKCIEMQSPPIHISGEDSTNSIKEFKIKPKKLIPNASSLRDRSVAAQTHKISRLMKSIAEEMEMSAANSSRVHIVDITYNEKGDDCNDAIRIKLMNGIHTLSEEMLSLLVNNIRAGGYAVSRERDAIVIKF
jgi:hypothetical protein